MAGKFDADCALMTAQTSLVISIISLVISFVTLAWNVWKDRTRLDITVSWDWSDWPPIAEPPHQLRVTIANIGGRSVYIDEILMVENLLADHPKLVGWQQELYILPTALWHRLRRFAYPPQVQLPPDELIHPIGRPLDPVIPPGANLHHRVKMEADDYEPSEPWSWPPEFCNDWRGLRIIVRSQKGKEWRSRPPTEKPSWFTVTKFTPPTRPPGVAATGA